MFSPSQIINIVGFSTNLGADLSKVGAVLRFALDCSLERRFEAIFLAFLFFDFILAVNIIKVIKKA